MAKTKIGGITVEIGADTSDLSKKLKEVNSESKKTTSELKSIDAALKQAPNSLELWKQKQEALSKAVENSKKKLEALVSEQENLKKGLQNGTVTEEAYKAYQREIEITKGQIESAEKTLKDFTDTQNKAGTAAEKTGKELEDSGKKAENSSDGYTMLKNVVANLAADGFEKLAKSVKEAWEEIDEGYDTIITKTGATGKELEDLQKVADNVFTTLPVEMSDTGAAVGEINTRLKVTGDELQDLTEYFLKYSKINNTQVASSVRNVSGIIKAFQEDIANTGKILDVLTDVSQKTGKDINSLESELLSNSATFKELDLDIRQSAELLGQFEANGVDTATALAGLKKAQQNATAEGKTMSKALGETINRIKEAKNETEALQIANDLFGKKGAAAITQAIREQRLSIEDLVAGYDDMRNVVSDTFEATQDAPDKTKIALNNLKLQLAQIGEVLLPKVEKAVDKGIKKIPQVIKTLKPVADGVKSFVNSMKPAVEILGNGLKNLITGATWLLQKIPSIRNAIQEAQREQLLSTLTAESKALSDGIDKDIEKMKELRTTAREQTEVDLSKTYKTEALYKELQGLVDENGKVKQGYEDRVNFIIKELEEATGIEIQQIDGIIQEYDKLQDKIEETIQKQRAEIFQKNYTDMYSEALAQNSQAANKIVQAQNIRAESQAYLDNLSERVRMMFEPGGRMANSNLTYDMIGELSDGTIEQWRKWDILTEEEATLAKSALKNKMNAGNAEANEKAAIARNNRIIEQYEKAEQALVNGNYAYAQGLFASIDDATIASFKGAKDNVDELVDYYKDQIDEVGKKIKASTDNNIKSADTAIKAEINELVTKMTNDGLHGADLLKTGIIDKLSQIDGFDTSALEEFMRMSGVTFGEILATQTVDSFGNNIPDSSVLMDMFYARNDLINEHSINSLADYEYWKNQGYDFHAIGGTEFGRGIIAEEGPELVEAINGGVRITPLTPTARNTPVGAGRGTTINNYYNSVKAVVAGKYDIYNMAEDLATAEQRIDQGKGK